jgi:hypothetical protein
MGQNYASNQDGFVYLTAQWQRRGNEPPGAVPGSKGRILERAAYEFFVRRTADGKADWTPEIEQRGVVRVPGWLGQYAGSPVCLASERGL